MRSLKLLTTLLATLLLSGCFVTKEGASPLLALNRQNLIAPWKAPFRLQELDEQGNPVNAPITVTMERVGPQRLPVYEMPLIRPLVTAEDRAEEGTTSTFIHPVGRKGHYMLVRTSGTSREDVRFNYIYAIQRGDVLTTYDETGLAALSLLVSVDEDRKKAEEAIRNSENPFANLDLDDSDVIRAGTALKSIMGPWDPARPFSEVSSWRGLLKAHEIVYSVPSVRKDISQSHFRILP